MLAVRPDPARSGGAARSHGSGLNLRALALAYAVFAVFAGLVAAFSGGDDGVWGTWAVSGYAVTAVALWRWPNSITALLPALIGALAGPLAWLAIHAPVTSDVETVSRSAILLLHHGSPYLPKAALVSWRSYNPYLPAMVIFGLPKAAGLPGLLGDPRPWLAVASAAVFALAFSRGTPHGAIRCGSCRRPVAQLAVFATVSPVCALSLGVGITDPPILALMCLGLALTARPSRPALAGVAIGVACAMKAIAWPAFPVMAAMLVARDGARAATRFGVASLATAAVLVAALAPAMLTRPSAFFQNTVAFPLGATPQHTPAASPLPGHLLAMTGPAGHAAAIGLLIAVALAVAASLVLRPPADTRAATWRLAIGLALFFALAPDARFGYFAYPGALLGWLVLTRQGRTAAAGPATAEPATAEPDPAAPPATATGRPATATDQPATATDQPATATDQPAMPAAQPATGTQPPAATAPPAGTTRILVAPTDGTVPGATTADAALREAASAGGAARLHFRRASRSRPATGGS